MWTGTPLKDGYHWCYTENTKMIVNVIDAETDNPQIITCNGDCKKFDLFHFKRTMNNRCMFYKIPVPKNPFRLEKHDND